MTELAAFNPFQNAAVFQEEFERLLRQALGDRQAASTAGAWSPRLDVEEDDESFRIYVELPGVSADDVDLTLEDNVLTVAGERRWYDGRDEAGFRRRERHFGRFHRAISLPGAVDAEDVSARYDDGVLSVRVGKSADARPRRIPVLEATG